METKVCSKCKRELSVEEFHLDKKAPDGRRADCRKCKSHTDRAVRYGLHSDKYEELYKEQKCLCAICLVPLKKVVVCVDHEHGTGKVRGLLCNSCNTALGLFRDHPAIVERAAKYLK